MDIERKPEYPSVKETLDEFPEIPQEVEAKDGAQATKVHFDTTVKDETGETLTESPTTKQVNIVIPSDIEQLEKLSKGSTDDSSTWFGAFFVRMFRKAMHFGWNIIKGVSPDLKPQ